MSRQLHHYHISWCSLWDLNPHAFATVFETALSAYSSKGAYCPAERGLGGSSMSNIVECKCLGVSSLWSCSGHQKGALLRMNLDFGASGEIGYSHFLSRPTGTGSTRPVSISTTLAYCVSLHAVTLLLCVLLEHHNVYTVHYMPCTLGRTA